MKELSLNVLDITMNSVKAGATLIEIFLTETETRLELIIRDNGCGMTDETVEQLKNPFYTTRTTRKVGMGVPLLTLAAEQTGGTMTVESRHKDAYPDNHGTVVTAVFHTDHIDCPPVGDMTATVTTLIQGHPDTDFYFRHVCDGTEVELDTRALREILGEVSLAEFEVLQWITGYLTDQYNGQ